MSENKEMNRREFLESFESIIPSFVVGVMAGGPLFLSVGKEEMKKLKKKNLDLQVENERLRDIIEELNNK